MSRLLPLCFRPYSPLGPRRRQGRQENHSPAARKGGLEKIFSREVFYFTSHLVFSASRLISLLPTLPPDAPAFYPRRAVAHQPLAMPDAHSLLMPEEAAARNIGNTKPAFGKKKVSIAIKKYQKCLFDKKKNVLLPYLTTNKNDKKHPHHAQQRILLLLFLLYHSGEAGRCVLKKMNQKHMNPAPKKRDFLFQNYIHVHEKNSNTRYQGLIPRHRRPPVF